MKKLCLVFVAFVTAACAAATPPPRFQAVSPADPEAPEAPAPPLALPRGGPSPAPAPRPTPHVHEGHHR